MTMIKSVFRNWHRYVLWAVISFMFWAWIVSRITNAFPRNKVTVYAETGAIDGEALTERFDGMLPDGIRLVEFNRFDAMIFQPTAVLSGDLYLIPESKADEYLASFLPIDTDAFPGGTFFMRDGKAYGVCVYDPETGTGAWDRYIAYPEDKRCYLFFSRDSRHIGTNKKAFDDAANAVATLFIKSGQEENP